MENKLFWMCALMILTLGLFPALSYAGGDTVIDTNGTVTINGNDVTITPNGNQPLIVNNVNLPNDKNLIINGDLNNVAPLPNIPFNSQPGPVITLVSNPPTVNLTNLTTGTIPLNIINQQPKTDVPQVATPKFPQIIRIDDPITPEPKQPELHSAENQHPYSSTPGASLYVTSQVSAANSSLQESPLVNIQGVEQAHDLSLSSSGEIILQ